MGQGVKRTVIQSILTAHLRNEITSQHTLNISYMLSFALCLGCCMVILCKLRDSPKNCLEALLCRYSIIPVPELFIAGLGPSTCIIHA